MQGKYDSDNRIPSVREYAASVEVNANTVMRSYERLTSRNLIFNKRGIGFFVSPDAKEKIRCEKSEELMQKQLPPLFRLMCNLGISPDTLKKAYFDFLSVNGQSV